MPPCFTLSIIRLGSKVKWSNPGNEVAPFPTPWCSSYWKVSLQVTLDYGRQLYFSVVDFRLILLLFLGKPHSRSEWRNPSANLCFSYHQFGPRIRTEGSVLVLDKKWKSLFLVTHCLRLLLPFPLWPNQVRTWLVWFFLRNKFLNLW